MGVNKSYKKGFKELFMLTKASTMTQMLIDEQPYITLRSIEDMTKHLQQLLLDMDNNEVEDIPKVTNLYHTILIMIEEAVQYEINRCENLSQ
jgi:hypothetical protein